MLFGQVSNPSLELEWRGALRKHFEIYFRFQQFFFPTPSAREDDVN